MSFELPKYFFPALLLIFAIAEYLSSPHYYSAFEFEKSPCFQKLIACSDTKPATYCLSEHGDSILAQARPVLTKVGFQAAQVCVDQVKQQSFQDSELLLNVQRCFYLAEMFALSPSPPPKPTSLAPLSSGKNAGASLVMYLVVACCLFQIFNGAALLEKVNRELSISCIEKWSKDGFSKLKNHCIPIIQSIVDILKACQEAIPPSPSKPVKEATFEEPPTPQAPKPSLRRSYPGSVHGLSRFLEVNDEFPSLSDMSSSGGSTTMFSDEEVVVEKVKPSFDISKESGRAAMKAYVEAKMRDNNYTKPQPTVRYREVPRKDAHQRKLRRVFIPRRGWVSLRRIEMEEYQDGRNALVRPC